MQPTQHTCQGSTKSQSFSMLKNRRDVGGPGNLYPYNIATGISPSKKRVQSPVFLNFIPCVLSHVQYVVLTLSMCPSHLSLEFCLMCEPAPTSTLWQMVSADRKTIFQWVQIPQLTIVVTSVTICFLLTTNKWKVGSLQVVKTDHICV